MDFPIKIRYALDVPCSKIGLYWPIKRHSPTEMTFAPTLKGDFVDPTHTVHRAMDERTTDQPALFSVALRRVVVVVVVVV